MMNKTKTWHRQKSQYSIKVRGVLNGSVRYIVAFGLMVVLSMGRVSSESVMPFGVGMLAALSFGGFHPALVGGLYVAACFITSPSVVTLIAPAAAAMVIGVSAYVHIKLGKDAPMSLILMYILLAQVGYIYTAFAGGSNPWDAVMTVALSAVFGYTCVTAVRTVAVKRIRFGLNRNDYACIAMVVVALGSGLVSVNGMNDMLLRTFMTAGALTLARAAGGMTAVGFGAMLGTGAAVATGNTAYIAAFCSVSIAAAMFGDLHRLFGAAAALSVDIVFGLHFEAFYGYGWVSVAAAALGAAVYLAVPKALIISLRGALGRSNERLSARHIINRSRRQLNLRLKEMGGAFSEMEEIFRGLTAAGIPDKDAAEVLSAKIPRLLCGGCAGSKNCLGEGAKGVVAAAHKELIGKALSKGRVNIIDVPQYISSRCEHVNALINAVNELSEGYYRQKEMTGNLNSARVLVADQFGGVAALLNNMAAAAEARVSFDTDKEAELVEELAYYDILCREVMLSVEEGGIYTVSLVVKSESMEFERLKSAVGRVLRSRMAVVAAEDTATLGWEAIVLKSAPGYDVVFGAAQTAKAGSRASGDTHSFVKIAEDKFLMALCDGMGSGESANRMSATALSLIENFYKAGFDNQTIISSVNSMLSVSSEESFSALDVCIVDLRRRRADFIKLGAPFGAVKHKGYCECVNAGALPLGILDDVRPVSYTRELADNDIIVLATDGITDIFEDGRAFCELVHSIETLNPQTLAQHVLGHCVEVDKGAPHDDMSVVAARIFPLC